MKPAFSPSHALTLLAALGASLADLPTLAQAAPVAVATADATKPADSGVDSNGFAPTLTPTRKRPAARGRTAETPYAPVRGGDDEGQIPEIEMFVGESRVFPTPGVARIAVGNGAALTADALDSKEVILFANAVGTSSLFIWNADGRYQRLKINIVPGDTSRYAREIAAFLSTIPRAKASIVGASVIVEGDNLSDSDLAKIDELGKRYPQIVNFTNRVGWEQMIQMDVKVVEFPVTALRQLGLDWSPAGGASLAAIWSPFRLGHGGPFMLNIPESAHGLPVTSPAGGPAPVPSNLNLLSVLNLGINAQLNLLAQQGKATLLAEPQLSARSGSKASFLAGGEIPYAVASRDGVFVQFKTYGVKLEITPRLHNNVIRAEVKTEVSGIDSSVSTVGGPALLSRQTNTEFNVRAGETIVLSGLLQREVHQDVTKVPFLGDIPILGALFRSTNYQNKETELVVFITPTLADPNTPGNVDRIEKTEARLEEQMGPAPFLSSPVQPGVRYEHPDVVPPAAPASAAAPVDAPAAAAVSRPVAVEPAVRQPLPNASPKPVPALAGDGFALSAEGSLLRVIKDAEPLRAAPVSTSQVLRFLRRNAAVVLGAQQPPPAAIGVWRNVKVGDLDGWVRYDGVEPLQGDLSHERTQAPAPLPPRRAVADETHARRAVTANASADIAAAAAQRFRVQLAGLQLHQTPDINSAVLRRLAVGDMVAGLPQPRDGSWTAVQAGDGSSATRGWVASDWIAPVATR